MRIAKTSLFWLHLVFGISAGLFILVMSVTGILLAFERQIKTFADSGVAYVKQAPLSAPLTPDAILLALESNGKGSPSDLVLHSDRRAAIEARFGRERSLYLDPFTGQIIGEPSIRTRAFFSAIERIHRSLGLGMQSAFGRGLTGASNLVFLFMIVSGLYLWLPRLYSRIALRNRFWVRRRLHGRARDWNWHSVIGIWTAIPLFFIVLTGVVMSYPWANNLLYTLTGTEPPPTPSLGARQTSRTDHRQPFGTDPGHTEEFQSMESLLVIAEQQVPGWWSVTFAVPQPGDRAMDFSFDKSRGGHPEQVTHVLLKRNTGRVESFRPFSAQNSGRKLRVWARFLHTGEEFGLIGQTIATIACLGAVFLIYTGFSMFARRLARKWMDTSERLPSLQKVEDSALALSDQPGRA